MADFVAFYGIIDGEEGVHVVDFATGVSVGLAAGDSASSLYAAFCYDGVSRAVYAARNTAPQQGTLRPIDFALSPWSGDFPAHEFGGYRVVGLRVSSTPMGVLVFAAITSVFAGPYDVLVFDYDSGSYIGLLSDTPNCFFGAMDVSPDGSLLVVSDTDGSPYIKCYDTSDLSALSALATQPAAIASGVVFSPDGALFAVFEAAATPRVLLYDGVSRAHIRTYTLSSSYLSCAGMAFSNAGDQLAVLSSTNGASAQLRVLDATSTSTLHTSSQSFASTVSPGILRDKSMCWALDDSLLFIREQVFDPADGFSSVVFYDISPDLALDLRVLTETELAAFWTNFRQAHETI